MHLYTPRIRRPMPRREQRIALRVAAVLLDVLARLQEVRDPEEEDGAAEGSQGHAALDALALFSLFLSCSSGLE
jgi:hypothetical protein